MPDKSLHTQTKSSEATVTQLYADFNDIAEDGTLPLTCRGSLESIAVLERPLRDGQEVWLSDGELGVRGQVFRRNDGSWEARSDWRFGNENG
jgi:hypothetical protein